MVDKSEYIEKAKARLDQWNAEIEKLKAKADEAEADAKVGYQKQIEEIRAQRDEAEKKMKEMQAASGDAWHEMKAGLDKAWDDLGKAFQNAMARFR